MQPRFSIRDAITFGWHKTFAHSAVLFQGMLALFAIQIATSIVQKVLPNTLQGFLAILALTVAGVIIGTGFTLVTLKIAKGEPATYKNLVPPAKLVWTYLLASGLVGLIVLCGFVALIIPGVYFLARFSLVRFAVLDGASVRESLKKSSELSEGVKWRLLAFILAMIGLNIVGALLLLVGLLVTVPVSAIAYAHVYLKLKNHTR